MGSEIWTMIAIPIFIIVLFLFGTDANFSLGKVGAIFWIVSLIALIYGYYSGSFILMCIGIGIIYLRASGKLGT